MHPSTSVGRTVLSGQPVTVRSASRDSQTLSAPRRASYWVFKVHPPDTVVVGAGAGAATGTGAGAGAGASRVTTTRGAGAAMGGPSVGSPQVPGAGGGAQ